MFNILECSCELFRNLILLCNVTADVSHKNSYACRNYPQVFNVKFRVNLLWDVHGELLADNPYNNPQEIPPVHKFFPKYYCDFLIFRETKSVIKLFVDKKSLDDLLEKL